MRPPTARYDAGMVTPSVRALSPIWLLGCLLAQTEPTPVLDDATFHALWQQVVPSADELQWRRIAWRSTLAEAVVDAQAADRPILLWAMNGHPLACT